MPTCCKCNVQFPNRTEINGKQINISKRKYCLICSPFDKHNTRKLEKPKFNRRTRYLTKITKRCSNCDKVKEIAIVNSKCSTCRILEKRKRNKNKAVLLLGGKCKICGYDKCSKALDFHHIDSSKKNFAMSSNWHWSWNKIVEELKKCILLCNRCHVEVHNGMNIDMLNRYTTVA